MATPKKHVRSNKKQIEYMCRYMAQHPDFAAGDYKTPQGAVAMEQQWVRLKEALDELGPSRSVGQWKTAWRDQKRKARVEGGALSKANNATGNVMEVPNLSENASLVLSTIGQAMAVGCGPEESPIGFTASPSLASSSTPSTSTQSKPTPNPPPPPPAASRRTRGRKIHPPDTFLKAQAEQNVLLKEIVEELRKGNRLRQEHNNIILRRYYRK